MLETNIRIVYPGAGLYVWTRKAVVSGSSLSPDLLEKACNKLRRKYGIAAIRFPGEQDSLLVATKSPIDSMHLEDQDWEMDVHDSGKESRKITFSEPFGKQTIPTLIAQGFFMTKSQLWSKMEFPFIDAMRSAHWKSMK